MCGCGTLVRKLWAVGHHRKGATFELSEEAREKIRQSKLGYKNPQFGKPGTCLGRKQTPEQIKKIKDARAKQVITLEHRIKISEGLKKAYEKGVRTDIKEKKKFWKGGIIAETKRIRKSFEIRLWREAVFARDDWTCQECRVRGGELNAHHIKSFAWFPELRTAIDNGVTLCKKCHLKHGTYKGKNPEIKQNVL